MSSIEITIDDKAVQAAFARLRDLGEDLTPVMRKAAGHLADATEDAFQQQRYPDGQIPTDGQDPASESLDDWLKRQTHAAQDAMLGPTRAALWRSGSIEPRNLLGPGRDALTMAEFKASGMVSAYELARIGGRHAGFLTERRNYTVAQL